MIYVYLIIVGKREHCADVISHNDSSFRCNELVLTISDSEIEEETRDVTVTHSTIIVLHHSTSSECVTAFI